MSLLQQFQDNWQKKKFVADGHIVLLAVSGGTDSMVMCTLFLESNIPFAVAHCNFQLRGEASDIDEELVREWTKKHKIKFHSTRFDTNSIKEEWKKGTQETARILRYEWFDELLQTNKYAKIATAHHADDTAETVLMNLFKGTGISGLHGIPEQNGNIIRPLLFALKESLGAYALTNHIPYREDASNASDAYLRNAVRLHIMPAIKNWFPDAVRRVNESAYRIGQAETLYEQAVTSYRKKLLEKRGPDQYIPILKLQKARPLETICYELFTPFGFTTGQIPQILELLHSESGHYINSQTHRVIKNRDFLIITAIPTIATDLILIDGVPCQVQAGHNRFSFTIEDKPRILTTDNNIAIIDFAAVEHPLILRKWRTGDYFYPLGMGMKKKKLSRFFIDQKLALNEKEQVWVLEANKRIIWVTGLRLDERFKVNETTEKILKIERRNN